jgi:hypothetical protein
MTLLDTWDDYTARTFWRFGGYEAAYGSFPGRVASFLACVESAIDEFVSDLVDAFVFIISALLNVGAVEYHAPEIPRIAQPLKPVRRYVIRPKALHGVIASLAPPVLAKGQRQKLLSP